MVKNIIYIYNHKWYRHDTLYHKLIHRQNKTRSGSDNRSDNTNINPNKYRNHGRENESC